MSAKPPVSASQIINLISSSPLQQCSPTTRDDDSLPSSPLLPSPNAMLRHFVERAAAKKTKETQEDKGKDERAPLWIAPNDVEELEDLPPRLPAAKKKRVTKTATDTVKKPRARKATEGLNAEKNKVPLKDGKLKARVVKRAPQIDARSKYFSDEPRGKETTISGLPAHDQQILQDTSVILEKVSKKKALLPKSPNRRPSLDPPLHVVRRQWTPVKDTVLILDNSSPLVNGEPKKTKKEAFGSLVEVMRYSTESFQSSREVSANIEDRVGNGLTKRRAIEMIGLPNSTTVAKEKPLKLSKPKLPKKKAKTITDQATAQYRSTNDPLLQGFSLQETPFNTDSQIPLRKPGLPAKKKRKSDPELVILLSPTSARKKFDDQLFVFGTCSQLERLGEGGAASGSQMVFDDQKDNHSLPPPSISMVKGGFLKNLVKEPKCGKGDNDLMNTGYDDSVGAAAADKHEQPAQDPSQRESRLGIIRKTGGLWDAAARGLDGELMSVDVVDMTGSDNGSPESESVGWREEFKARELSGDGKMITGIDVTGRSVTHNDPLDSCPNIRREPQLSRASTAVGESNGLQSTRSPGVTWSATTTLKSSSTIDDPNPSLKISTKKSMTSTQSKSAPVMPDFQSYLTSRLKAEVAKFGFKDMKTRDRMVSCLERCWEAKNKVTTARSTTQQPKTHARPVENTTRFPERDLGDNEMAPALQDEPAPLEKPRAVTKRKKAEEATPKPPRRKPALKNRKLPVKGPIPSADPPAEPSPKPSPPPKNPRGRGAPMSSSPQLAALKTTLLHSRISEAVRESGQTESEFSFYHAILMYDPIILEDLTVWLNAKMNSEDENIDVEVVKDWCEANGVCCVRGESLRGGQRKRL